MNFLQSAKKFSKRIDKLKRKNSSGDFTWYGYDSMSNFSHLHRLLEEDLQGVFFRNRDLPMLDIGAADGDVAYFLDSLGFEVDIFDNPPTNWNGMQGVRTLKELLESNVRIFEIDLDNCFELPRDRFGLVLLLGTLYHLKNPYYVLEKLARQSREIILSTRIAGFFKQNPSAPMAEIPCAYLLDPEECNNDSTNYWIFSRAGLARLLMRTGWTVEKVVVVGDTEASNPSDGDHDERAFVYARSRY